ncbi:DsbA family oxidoreductase [uncultured Roseobacter sp.]|uniref:DsbA family oxidoreductase n=1 Tax=uncultured Roseobacter sp. TaxID=114847 RepID=UPI002620D924|nr:DsbA family oxidoreductase [uncultured Roseobacter sp.]
MSQPTAQNDTIQVDIVSDVMCPWCIVGFRQLENALAAMEQTARVRWYPFELNPDMPAEGQKLSDHMAEKYGATPQQSLENRNRLKDLGAELGIQFNFTDESRILNTFLAHQLLDWAETHGMQHPLKMALFYAYFTDGRDVSNLDTLAQIAHSTGLDAEAAKAVLQSGENAEAVRTKQHFWTSRGISGVPSMIFGGKYLLTGAQGENAYKEILRNMLKDAKAA